MASVKVGEKIWKTDVFNLILSSTPFYYYFLNKPEPVSSNT